MCPTRQGFGRVLEHGVWQPLWRRLGCGGHGGLGDRLLETFDPSVISVADTVGMATPAQVKDVFGQCVPRWGQDKIGAHLHMNPLDGMRKVEAAHEAGCLRFDGAIRGVGGCPMAQDDLVGNAPTERLVEWAEQKGLWKAKSSLALDQAQSMAADLFG